MDRSRTLVLIGIGAAVLSFGVVEAVHLANIASFAHRHLPVCRVEGASKVVALTVDDGPDREYTPEVLSLLRQHDARGTFFVIGRRADDRPDLVAAEFAAGMEVANHGWSHVRFTGMSTDQAMSEIDRTQAALSELGVRSRLVRAPFGEISPDQLRALTSSGFRPVHWSLALDHYVGGLGMSPTEAAVSLADDVRSGDIILAHDAPVGDELFSAERRQALQALALLLPRLRAAGYRIVPVGELLSDGSEVKATPRKWFWQSGFSCARD